MSVKSKIAKPSKEFSFPCLRESGERPGLVVLFLGENEGVVVAQGESGYQVGHHSSGWLKAELWEPFYGVVELSND